MMRGRDHVELRAFVAVAEHGSFARAAAHLRLSPSSLSAIIRSLEERLGVRLLNRTTRSVGLSQAGSALLDRLRPALAELDAAVTEAASQDGAPSGTLRVNATRIAAIHHLAPLVASFIDAYPNVSLDLVVDDRLVDIVADGFDAGIRLGEKLERDMIAVRLSGDLEMMVVAALAYLDRVGTPRSPRDLTAHRCLNFRWPTDGSLYRWEFERGSEILEISVDGPLTSSEPEVLIRVALDGAGIAYLFANQVEEHIAAGRLVRLLPDWTPAFPGFFIYYPSRRQLRPPLRAFLDHVSRPAP